MRKKKRIKKAINVVIGALLILLLLDLLILTVGLLQVAVEGQIGDWSAFWRVQVESLLWFQRLF